MKSLLVLLLALASAAALAQPGRGRPYGQDARQRPPAQQPLPPDERERLRDDLRRDPYRDSAQAPNRPLPPEQRERLRRDVRDAYRNSDRRR